MSDSKLAIEVAAVLDEFAATQRAQGVAQARLQKIIFARQIGEGQVQFEAVIDEAAEATEIYQTLARIDAAADRLKAKHDLSDHYGRLLNICGQIELSAKKAAEDEVEFQAKNAARNAGKRIAIVMTDQQTAALKQHRDAIRDGFERIAELQKAIAECRRVLDGEDPFSVLDGQIAGRLDKLRGSRPAAA